MKIDYSICMQCGVCVGTCPENAVFLYNTVTFNDDCTNCGICMLACPIGAIIE
jgi:NAD-dependent dihydropyrimidine dehydrogenase PreA subunit